MKRIVIFAAILTLIAIALLIFVFAKRGGKSEFIQTTGIVEGEEVNIAATVPGRLLEECCGEGDAVREGTIVVKLESEGLRASVEQASAGVEKAMAEVRVAESAIETSKANIKSAEADIRNAEAEALCSRVAIIDSGRIIALGSPEELKSKIPGNDIISLILENLSQNLVDRVKNLPFVHTVNAEESSIRIYVDSGAQDLPMLLDEVRSSGGKVLSAMVHEQSLEDVFIHYTGKSIREEEAKKVSFLLGAGVPQK
jgi:multidrug efflux pump subunit AcrA (membrane-fusion protein)